MAIGIIETRRDWSRSVSAVGLRLCSHPTIHQGSCGKLEDVSAPDFGDQDKEVASTQHQAQETRRYF
ncbi:MAG TPA: hypothetical protein VFB13_14055 [Reyranella sp.]|nr:hypothetical protein [Reyranella sp.]